MLPRGGRPPCRAGPAARCPARRGQRRRCIVPRGGLVPRRGALEVGQRLRPGGEPLLEQPAAVPGRRRTGVVPAGVRPARVRAGLPLGGRLLPRGGDGLRRRARRETRRVRLELPRRIAHRAVRVVRILGARQLRRAADDTRAQCEVLDVRHRRLCRRGRSRHRPRRRARRPAGGLPGLRRVERRARSEGQPAGMFSVPAGLPETGVVVASRIALIWSGVRFGFAWSRSAAAPATCGAENEVPLIRTYPGSRRAVAGTCASRAVRPGAASRCAGPAP